MVDRPRRHIQAIRDLGVAEAPCEQLQNFELPRREMSRVRTRARAWSARHTPRARLAQPTGDDAGRTATSQSLELGQCAAECIIVVSAGQCQRRLVRTVSL